MSCDCITCPFINKTTMSGFVIRVVSTEGLDLPSLWFVPPQTIIVSVCEDTDRGVDYIYRTKLLGNY
jgi:hypothetical protein